MTRARKKTRPSVGPRIDELPVRTYRVLNIIRAQYGSATRAAFDGAINAAEYLKLERLSVH